MKKKLALSLGGGLILSSIALYLAFRNVPVGDLVTYLGAIDYIWVVPAVLLVVICFFLRAVRWQLIVNSSERITFWQSYHPLMIGFMLNCILPRAGEVARPLILTRREKIPFSTGIATVAAERFLDIIFVLGFLSFAFASVPMDSSLQISFGSTHLNRETLVMLGKNTIWICIILFAAIAVIAMDKPRQAIGTILLKLPDILFRYASHANREKFRFRVSLPLVGILDHAAKGVALLKSPKRLCACLGLSLLIWFLSALSYAVMAIGCPGIDLALHEFIIVMVIVNIFIALPSVPGFWGVWEAGGVFALSLFGVASKTAGGFTLANHAVQMFPVIIMGLVSAVSVSINVFKISGGASLRENHGKHDSP